MIYHRMLGFTTSTPRTSRFQPVLWALMALSLLLAPVRGQNATTIEFESVSGTVLTLGDTARFRIKIDTHGEDIYGFSVYLSIPDTVFAPVFTPSQEPFIPGTWINEAPTVNDTHEDTLGQDTDDIPGIQYNYSQFDAYNTVRGMGYAAEFELVPIAVPDNPTGAVTLRFDRTAWIGSRETIYLWQTPFNKIEGKEFKTYPPLDLQIAGARINPAIPDTNLTPGASWTIPLDNYFTSSVYLPDDPGVSWTIIQNNVPFGPNVNYNGGTRELSITNTSGAHGKLDLTVYLAATGKPEGDFFDTARVLITVDYPPVFTTPLPAQPFTYDEDDSLKLVSSNIFTDDDDGGANISVRLEPASPIHVNYDGGAGTIAFSADANYFSVAPFDTARLFITDGLGVTIDSLIKFTVNSVNDPPVVSLDSVSALGDTVVIHRASPDTLDLDLFVTDVDDASFTWSYTDPYPDTLAVTLIAGHLLRLEADSTSPFIDIPLLLTATDDSSASASDTLVVSIRSWPPEIGPLPDIRMLADTPDTLELNPLVDDNDTDDALMTWSFEVVDYITKVPDPQVSYTYDQASQTVIFNTPPGYAATDLLRLTVLDDDNNTDTDSTRLTVFATLSPVIYPLDTVVVFRDTSTQVLDLDDYVGDPIFSPDTLTWTIIYDGDSLKAVSIDNEHVVTIETYPGFFGWDSVIFAVENPEGYTDTSTLIVRVIPRYDGPPVWYSIQDTVENVYPYIDTLFILTDVCKDDFTPGDQLNFTPFVNPDLLKPLNLDIDPTTLVASISVPATGNYTTWFYFSAEDAMGQVSNSDTVQVLIKDSYSPVWQRIPTISMNVNETRSDTLSKYLSDRDTPDNLLIIDVVNLDSSLITVSYDAVTTELTVQAGAQARDCWLIITATDDKLNTAITMVHVVVFAVPDRDPPAGGLTYFFNPAADKWIHYVAVADNTTDISRFIWYYHYGVPPNRLDYSNYLSFALQDTLPGTVTWIASYHFQNEGSYALTVEIIDAANNMLAISPVSLSVGFSKAIGGVLTSPDRQLTVSYPPAPIPNGKLLIISEDSLPVSTGLSIAKTLSARGNEENGSQVPAMVYSLDTNLPEPILVTLTYHQKRDTDPYYSFYELDGDQLVKIETYTSADGHFEAAAKLDRDIVFAPSDAPARDAPLPGAELLCYPNPFNATIQVRFLLRWQDQGRIVIYNLLGREVYASPRQPLEPGVHAFSWHSIDKRGLPVPSGTYFIRLETDGGKVVTRKVTLLK